MTDFTRYSRALPRRRMTAPSLDDRNRGCNAVTQVINERHRNLERWGQQDYPSLAPGLCGDTACRMYRIPTEAEARRTCEGFAHKGAVTWTDILLEEFAEVVAAPDDNRRRAELVQVAAVALTWIECLDRRADAMLDAKPSSTQRPPLSAFDHACERAENEQRANQAAEQAKWTSLDNVRNRISMRLAWLRNGDGIDLKEFADDIARLMQHVPGAVEVSP